MTELSPIDEANVQRIVDAIIARSREEIRRMALLDAINTINLHKTGSAYDPGRDAAIRNIRALIAAPPAAPPADVTRAMARLFKRVWDQDGGISASEFSDWLCELKFCDWQVEGNRPVLSAFGEAALSIAEGE